MKNVFSFLECDIKKQIQALVIFDKKEVDFANVNLSIPPENQGELSTNAAMVLCKQAGLAANDLAKLIIEELAKLNYIENIEVAGAGFINFSLDRMFWCRHLQDIFHSSSFGRGEANSESNGKKINVEYVSANPTGPMHVGHCRGAVVGDVLANLLEFAGNKVAREYYVNDAGGQIDLLAHSVYWHYCEFFNKTKDEMPENLYQGKYLIEVAKDFANKFSNKYVKCEASVWLDIFKQETIKIMMASIRQDLKSLSIEHDTFFFESSLHSKQNGKSAIEKTIDYLQEKDFVYFGTLPPPKGKKGGEKIENYEARQQLLFKATSVGDDNDRPLSKSNGEYTYFAADMAYFKDKFDRGFDEMIYILGADHAGYVKRMQALARAISGDRAHLTIRLCQLVKLFANGEPVKMSKRSGEFITLRELVEDVGKDVVRFMMLYRKNDVPLDFHYERVKQQSKDNPVFYVQYAYARCYSVFRRASEMKVDEKSGDCALLVDKGELELIRKLAYFPRLIEKAAQFHEPHRLAFYLYDLATLFHSQWNRGQNDINLRFLNPDEPNLTGARLILLHAVAKVLALGLEIIGVTALKEMK